MSAAIFHSSSDCQNFLPWATQGGCLQPSIGMANVRLASFDSPGALSMWPFLLSREGICTLAPQRHSLDHPDQRAPHALQRIKPSRRVADFSIRSILALDGSEEEGENHEEPAGGTTEWAEPPQGKAWICCTRFKPPSVPKKKRVRSPRPTSRSPRVPFSATQLGTLEKSFQQTRYLSTGQVRDVALMLGLTENRVKIWFQNRRARERRDFLKQHPNSSIGVNGNPLQGQPCSGWH